MSKNSFYKPEEIINKLREAEALLGKGMTTGQACRKIGISENTYYKWRKEYDERRRVESEAEALEKEIADMIPNLLKSTKKVPELREKILEAVGALSFTIPAVMDKIVNSIADPEITLKAVASLASLGEMAIPQLAKACKHSNPSIRHGSAHALRVMKCDIKPALEEIYTVLTGDKATWRRFAADTLATIGKRSVDTLVEALKHDNPDVRWRAAWALGHIGRKAVKAVDILKELTHDPDENVEIHAFWALEKIEKKPRK